MTGTLCQSAALDRIIAPWAAKVALFFGAIVKTIVTIAEIVILHALGTCCRRAAQRLPALWTKSSWPIVTMPKTMGRRVANGGTASAMTADLDVLVRAGAQSQASLVAARLPDRRLNGDDGEGELAKLKALNAPRERSERQTCRHVNSA